METKFSSTDLNSKACYLNDEIDSIEDKLIEVKYRVEKLNFDLIMSMDPKFQISINKSETECEECNKNNLL